jgi:hypothetical protein
VLIDELLEIGLRNQLRRWVPDKIAPKLKLAHGLILLSFRAKSRNPAMKPLGNAAGFFRSHGVHPERAKRVERATLRMTGSGVAPDEFVGRLKLQLFP